MVVGSAARDWIGGIRGCLRDSYVLIRRLRACSAVAVSKGVILRIRDLKTEAAD